MDPRMQIGKMLIIAGIAMISIGALVLLYDKIPYIGRLPGDFTFRGKGWSVHAPLATSLLLSLILTFLLNFFFRR